MDSTTELDSRLLEINPLPPWRVAIFEFLFPPLLLVLFPLNWKRLGKPQWAAPTFFFGTITTAILGVGLVYIQFVLHSNDVKVPVIVFVVGMIHFGYWTAVGSLQSSAYEKWHQTRDPIAVLNHRYNFTWAGLILSGFLVAAAMMVILYAYLDQKRTTLETDLLTLEHRSWWEVIPNDVSIYCQNTGYECVANLVKQPHSESNLVISYFLTDPSANFTDIDKEIWDNMLAERGTNIQIENFDDFQIDGLNGTKREYSELRPDLGRAYVLQIHVLNGTYFYEILAWSDDETVFEENREEVEEMINSIDFK